MRAIVIALVLSGCANVHVNRAALVASTAALALDWHYTRGAAASGWRCGGASLEEVGMARAVIGQTPSARDVDVYFAASAVLNLAIWSVVPVRYKSAIPIGVIGIQAKAIVRNMDGIAASCI
jgi:hypothetical protein